MFLLLILIYPIIVLVVLVALNQKGLLPGTYRYRMIRKREEEKLLLEVSRMNTIASRYRMKENEMLDRAMKELEAPKA